MKNWKLLTLTLIIGSVFTFIGGLVWWYVNSNVGHAMMFGGLFGMIYESFLIGKKWRKEKTEIKT